MSVFGFMCITVGFADPAAILRAFAAVGIARSVVAAPSTTTDDSPGAHAALGAALPDHLRVIPKSPSGGLVDRDDRGGQGDARIHLRDAATLARRGVIWARSSDGETRTDFWVNAPESIGSTSRLVFAGGSVAPPDPSSWAARQSIDPDC
jgi:hypothetical protein